MRRIRKDQRVTDDVARHRVLDFLREYREQGMPPSFVANRVWPGNEMTPQGAALAVAPILKRMEKDGLIRYVYRNRWGQKTRGWVIA